ncbi:secreted RxLR effector protein 161-like [Amaranthus tricolor]|uniref:secreted RxLR effector protein 161-like n=1 Tax=Amaranthus tricolor TaxID=29722 RepID=UPI0025908A07|nr:secreted RxLR effector protein 161-like [Amaranthus tricolor]
MLRKYLSVLADKASVSTTMEPGIKFAKHMGQIISQLEYSKVIGLSMYPMTRTRPDIAFAVGKLSRFTSNPSPLYWMAIRRVLRCLLRTKDYGIAYGGEPPILEGYSDASWITNEEDNSSTSGWVFVYGGGVISWSSK